MEFLSKSRSSLTHLLFFLSFTFLHPLSIEAQILTISSANGFCPNGSVTLTATDSFQNYQWSNGATSRSITVNSAGNYTVTALNLTTNAVDTARKFISAFNNPVPVFNGTPFICPNRPTNISTQTRYRNYRWSTGDTAISLTIYTAGTYSVTVTDFNGCLGSGTAEPVVDGSTLALKLPDTVKICGGDSVVLNATSPNAILYYWNSDDTTPTLTVRTAGRYDVFVSNGQCVSYDTTHVLVLPKPTINLGRDTIICKYDTLRLKASVVSPLYTYLWQDSSRSPIFLAADSGLYHLKVNFGRCEARDSVHLGVFNARQDYQFDTIVCTPQYRISPRYDGTTAYSWTSNGSKDSTLTVSESGVYQVLATNGRCFTNLKYGVTFRKLTPINLGADTVLCLDLGQKTFMLKVDSVQFRNFYWSDESKEKTLRVSQSGVYKVDASNECGMSSDSIRVEFRNCFNPFVPTAFSPNDDTNNDIFKVYPTQDIAKIRSFQIFDRWGNRVFIRTNFLATESDQNGWNGAFGGRILPPSVFVYFLEVETKRGEVLVQKGDVTLIR